MKESLKNSSNQTSLSVNSEEINLEKYKLLMFKVQEQKVENLWTKFEEHNLEPILIKGWRAAQYYPKPYQRSIGDIDLAVNPEYYEKALRLKTELSGAGEIDLHKGLKYLDKADWKDLFSKSVFLPCGKAVVRVLRREDDLRVLCTHWLIDGGVNKEKLWDIYYALETRPADFDWDRFLNAAGEKRRKWFVCMVGIAHKYLGLEIEDMPIREEAKNLPKWISRTIEREWRSDIKFKYLLASLDSPKEFFQQIKKRIPPNPIQATVEMEGFFDNKPRIIYQIPNMIYRLVPSLKRFTLIKFPVPSGFDRD